MSRRMSRHLSMLGAIALLQPRKPRCSLPAFHCLAVNTGDTIGLESADILQIQERRSSLAQEASAMRCDRSSEKTRGFID